MTAIPKFTYSHWRHGGWYVHGVRYQSGAIGCVSRNYEDGKWRIVCDPRPFEDRPTFKTREEAARAEWRLANDEDSRIDAASFEQTRPNTRFSYLYRDAANYKQDETVVLAGPLSLAEARAIIDGTDDEDGFVPSAVGLDDLQDRTVNGWQADVDHPFHEITSLALTDDAPTSSLNAREFLSRFLSADWEAAARRVEARHAAQRRAEPIGGSLNQQQIQGATDMDSEMPFLDLADAMQIVLDLASLQIGNAEPRACRDIAQLDDVTMRGAIATVEDFAVNQLGDD